MQTISDTEACHRFPSLLDADESAALEETLHLLSTPANAEQLRQGLRDFAAGKRMTGELCD